MKWFSEKHTRESHKNGLITVRRILGKWEVLSGGCEQTTPYTHAMWADAYKRLTKEFDTSRIKRVLMLGLGAGGEVKLLYETFPGSELTAVEYDKEMIALTRELALYKPYPAPAIIDGDAREVLPALDKKFDLIMIDLFNGPEPSVLITDPDFVHALKSRLEENGFLLVNVYGRPEYLKVPAEIFAEAKQWVYKFNTLGLFFDLKL